MKHHVKMFQMLQEYYILLEKKYTNKTSSKIWNKCNWFSRNQLHSYMEVNTKNNAFQFVITLCHYRIENMENTFGKHLINEAINNQNLSDKEIKNFYLLNH